MRLLTLRVIIVLYRDSHDLCPHHSELHSLKWLGIHIIPNFVRPLVLDLEFLLGYFVRDQKKTVLDVPAVLPIWHPTVLSQKDS